MGVAFCRADRFFGFSVLVYSEYLSGSSKNTKSSTITPTAIRNDFILPERFIFMFSPTFYHLISLTLGTFSTYSGSWLSSLEMPSYSISPLVPYLNFWKPVRA